MYAVIFTEITYSIDYLRMYQEISVGKQNKLRGEREEGGEKTRTIKGGDRRCPCTSSSTFACVAWPVEPCAQMGCSM